MQMGGLPLPASTADVASDLDGDLADGSGRLRIGRLDAIMMRVVAVSSRSFIRAAPITGGAAHSALTPDVARALARLWFSRGFTAFGVKPT